MADLASQASLAFVAGLISVFSPCVMPLMPAYLSLVSGVSVEEMEEGVHDAELRARVMRACFGFVVGFSVVFAGGVSRTLFVVAFVSPPVLSFPVGFESHELIARNASAMLAASARPVMRFIIVVSGSV